MQRFARLALPVLALFGTATIASEPVARAAELEAISKLAVVDVQRCLLDTKEGKKAKSELETAFKKGQSKIDKKAGEVQKQMADLQAKASMLSDSELRKRQEEIMRKQQELEQLGYELQEHVAEKEALLTEKIYNNVSTIVKQIALEEGVQVVLVRSEMTVIYVDPKLDLTNRVIVRYDKEHP
jgi:outer membrane protein